MPSFACVKSQALAMALALCAAKVDSDPDQWALLDSLSVPNLSPPSLGR